MTLENSYMESSASESIIYNEYKLALKFFMNKDFEKSYPIIKKLYAVSRDSVSKGHLGEPVFIKVCALYNTEIGLALNSSETFGNDLLTATEREQMVSELKSDKVLRDLEAIYGPGNVPSEILYSTFLVYYSCADVLTIEQVAGKFKNMYHKLEFEEDLKDEYLHRWLHMYVLNVLPDADDFDSAKSIISQNPLLDTSSLHDKLRDIETSKAAEKQLRKKNEKALKKKEEERLAEEKRKQQNEIDERNLKFRSLKQIKKEQESGAAGRTHSEPQGSTLEMLHSRLLHLLEITKRSLKEKSPVYLAAIIGLFLLARFLRVRRVNLREKIRETIKMALQVTYL